MFHFTQEKKLSGTITRGLCLAGRFSTPSRPRRPSFQRRSAYLDCASFHRALQRLVQRGFGLFIFLLRDSALLVFDFELEDLFFQGLE